MAALWKTDSHLERQLLADLRTFTPHWLQPIRSRRVGTPNRSFNKEKATLKVSRTAGNQAIMVRNS